MSQLTFYLQYAFRNLWRNRRWSTFAVFSIAAGVAAVVALRSLGLAIGDALTGSVRTTNHGDITLSVGYNTGFLSMDDPEDADTFSDADIERVRQWVEARGGRMTAYLSSSSIQLAALDYTTAGRPQFISTYLIDPATFPPTQDLLAVDPANIPLSELFQGGNEVVISKNLADSQGIAVGDTVRVSGTEEEFTVRGIVPTEAEAGLDNIFAGFFGFAYFDLAVRDKLPVPENPNLISIALPDGTSMEDIRAAEEELRNLTSAPSLRIRSVPELLERNQAIADIVSSLIVVMGLGALLIGGVGIINTMLVMVGRRTDEIASLKTFGMKGRQVAALFMSEAILLGLAGSIVGGALGVLLSGLANAYGQTLIQQPLRWRVYPDAVLFGLALGLVVTAVFGVLPVITAVKVRPGIILRPNETYIPRVGCLQSLFMLLLVIVVVGLIAGQILQPSFAVSQANFTPNPFVVGIIGVAVTLLILGFLVGVMWVIVWIVSHLPSFGNVDLRLALRNLTTRRLRTATTLLALSAGMFALSSISFFGAGAREIIQFTLSESFGGNVLIFTIIPPAISQPLIDARLNTIEGVSYRTRLMNYSGEIVAVNGERIDLQSTPSMDELADMMEAAAEEGDFERMAQIGEQMSIVRDYFVTLAARDTTNPNIATETLIAGRALTPEDRGQPVGVFRLSPTLQALGVEIGSTVTVEVGGREHDLEVVGLLPDDEESGFNFRPGEMGDVVIPPDALDAAPDFQFNIAQIEPEHLNQALIDLSALPLIFSIDISFIDNLLSRFINQMSAIPILVGLLSLGAAAVIMANTVALATLERRRQIGILKAVGLKGQRVLWIMLLENTLVSLLGGALGVGLSMLGVSLMTSLGVGFSIPLPRDATPTAIALIIAAVLIGWLATVLSARPALGEKVLNVLRYE
jgi:predicted lysophospholipase L1 biosynthesis ABC-type transport system permease subunit